MSWQARRYAPAPGQRLCALENVTEGECTELRYGAGDDAFTMLLYRLGLDVKVYVNCCPHFSLPLNARPGEFLMLSGARVMCAYHCAIFRLRDGYCVDGPAVGMALDSVPIEIRDGQIFVAAPV
jgi:nitrite reductase/ring-hydroxylating ferredoxin subunit